METFPLRVWQLLTVVVLLASQRPGCAHGGEIKESRVNQLLKLQEQAKDGVIHLDDESVRKFASPGPEPRPYTFFIFFDAAHMRDLRDLNLETHLAQFRLVATAFLKNNPDIIQRVFFAELDFLESEGSFAAFRVNALPKIKFLPSGNGSLEESYFMDWTKQRIVDFVEANTRKKVGPIENPPAFSKKQLIVLVGGLLVASPFVIQRIMAKDTALHDARFWVLNAVLLYLFSVTGGTFSILREVPFFVRDRDNPGQLNFFYHGREMQLGAEGFVIGSLYCLVGLLLAFATQLLYKIRSKTAQQILLLAVMGISVLAVGKVISLDNWKTGYSIHGFWPRLFR